MTQSDRPTPPTADAPAATTRPDGLPSKPLRPKEPESGFLCLVLHAHLPFVRHPGFDRFLEEDWLFEAILETYLPLLEVLERLAKNDAPFRLTMSFSPTLTAMLQDPVLQGRFVSHIGRLVELAEKEVARTKPEPKFHRLAQKYFELFRKYRDRYEKEYGRDLLGAFRRLQEAGVLETMTCGATHGFLPLMLGNRNLWRGQIEPAVAEHERVFGRKPRGIWLPECGFEEGIDEVLAEAGLEYFFVDTHGILHAHPRPRFGVYAPMRTPGGVYALGRDQHSSQQVWSAKAGYPGDPVYREFYRDVGWDLEYDYVKPYLHSDGKRTNLGIKYYRVTGSDEKDPYDFEQATTRAAEHATDFLQKRMQQAKTLKEHFDRRCLTVAPFDAELFGHWWFEGPQWLDFLLRKMHFDQNEVQTTTVPEYLERYPEVQEAMPSMSSWGHNGFCEYWIDKSNDWIYPHLQTAGERMIELANQAVRESVDSDSRGSTSTGVPAVGAVSASGPPALQRRALNQAARELLLAQSSDWAFILKTGTVTEYATFRFKQHIKNFTKLYHDIRSGEIDEEWLAGIEEDHPILPGMDYSVFADRG